MSIDLLKIMTKLCKAIKKSHDEQNRWHVDTPRNIWSGKIQNIASNSAGEISGGYHRKHM